MTVRFHSEIRNGAIIVPEDLRSELGDNVAVDVEVTSENGREGELVENYIDYLMKNPIRFDGPPVTREEIYEERLR
ncbi:MAG: hypothetical protein ABL952_17945 [Pyrinomonadaceae bacterium]